MSGKRLFAILLALIVMGLVVLAILRAAHALKSDIGKEQCRQGPGAMVNVPVVERRAAQLNAGREGQDGGGLHRFFYARIGIVNASQFS